MRRAVLFLLALLLAPPVLAQQGSAPILEVTVEQTEAIPGEMLSLRLTVLVPTFMPKPPVWPSFETPNLLVRLPEGSTGPTSKRIDGETWSGITRRYRISPMIAGTFAIPPQDVVITYADPETSKPIQATLRTDPLKFTGVIPEGAEGLDPFIAADRLELTEQIDGTPGDMKPGDSVIRTVTATIEGVSPMFLPTLLPQVAIDGIAAYPAEPAVEEKDNRGEISGSRTERVTLLAEGGGSGDV
ncbi:MAG: BatD family protein, partial [Bauldia sp.]|nr:BatD family protein [Bauldia sp.]